MLSWHLLMMNLKLQVYFLNSSKQCYFHFSITNNCLFRLLFFLSSSSQLLLALKVHNLCPDKEMLQNGLNVRLKAIFIIHASAAAGSILHLPFENEVISSNRYKYFRFWDNKHWPWSSKLESYLLAFYAKSFRHFLGNAASI